ncbi:MAG: hypothetical protein QXN63_01155 [Candidatus Bathyarchaeia archaeon]
MKIAVLLLACIVALSLFSAFMVTTRLLTTLGANTQETHKTLGDPIESPRPNNEKTLGDPIESPRPNSIQKG